MFYKLAAIKQLLQQYIIALIRFTQYKIHFKSTCSHCIYRYLHKDTVCIVR